MSVSDGLQVAWRTWQGTSRPFPNFQCQRSDAATYRIECDLDHQADYIVVLFEAWRDRNPHWDVPTRAERELGDLRTLEEQLHALGSSGPEIHALETYIRTTRALLEGLAREAAGRSETADGFVK
jgi:hypothetical protein